MSLDRVSIELLAPDPILLVKICISVKPFELEALLVILADHIDNFLHGDPLSTKPLSGQHRVHCETTVAADGELEPLCLWRRMLVRPLDMSVRHPGATDLGARYRNFVFGLNSTSSISDSVDPITDEEVIESSTSTTRAGAGTLRGRGAALPNRRRGRHGYLLGGPEGLSQNMLDPCTATVLRRGQAHYACKVEGESVLVWSIVGPQRAAHVPGHRQRSLATQAHVQHVASQCVKPNRIEVQYHMTEVRSNLPCEGPRLASLEVCLVPAFGYAPFLYGLSLLARRNGQDKLNTCLRRRLQQ